MTKSAEKIKTELSLLSQQERAELAYFLIRSLDAEVNADAEAAWDAELAQRLEDIKSGKSVGEPADKVFAEIRGEYSWRRLSSSMKSGRSLRSPSPIKMYSRQDWGWLFSQPLRKPSGEFSRTHRSVRLTRRPSFATTPSNGFHTSSSMWCWKKTSGL